MELMVYSTDIVHCTMTMLNEEGLARGLAHAERGQEFVFDSCDRWLVGKDEYASGDFFRGGFP